MIDATVTVRTRSFVCIAGRFDKKVMPVENRSPESVNYPDECTFYFFDSYVGVVDGVEYRFGPELNVSQKYYCGSTYYPNPEHFRTYFMRCYGWSEEQISKRCNNLVFGEYNESEYPNGVIIVNGTITNPKNGTILSVKDTVDHEVFPSEEVIRNYRCAD